MGRRSETIVKADDPSVKVIAVESVSSFKSRCMVVKVEGEDEITQCTKCNMVQFIAEAKYLLAPNFTVKTTSGEMIHIGTILLNM